MSEIKVGDKVRVVNHDHNVDGTALRNYPGYSSGSHHIVIGISEENAGKMYHLIPANTKWVGAFAPEIVKVDEW